VWKLIREKVTVATAVRMRQPQTGIVKTGYFGFSWTSFFFGGFPALMRGDIWIGLAVLAGSLVASAFSAGLLWFVVGLIWAVIYNKMYTQKLLQQGFILEDDPRRVEEARRALNIA
jgi:hypothetical protein